LTFYDNDVEKYCSSQLQLLKQWLAWMMLVLEYLHYGAFTVGRR